MAILYRANHQSRQFEECLLKERLPYKIFGGQRFFERVEIKDVLAYLRLVANPFDDAAFDRIVNWPTRGIGKQSLITLREYGRENNLTLWQAIDGVISKDLLKNRAKTNLLNFAAVINDFKLLSETASLSQLVENVITQSGLRDYYYKDDKSKNKSRIENLDELINACYIFEQDINSQTGIINDLTNEELELTNLQAFLSHAVLESGSVQENADEDALNLMTIHTAKGLEFNTVFIVGLEEKLFPHEMCMFEPAQLAEERRLCYVAITRAMKKLYFTFCESRRLRGEQIYNLPSRFLKDIPQNLLINEQVSTSIEPAEKSSYSYGSGNQFSYKPKPKKAKLNNISLLNTSNTDSEYQLGQSVNHAMFGLGVVLNSDGSGDKVRVQVKFSSPHGVKWLIAKIAKLEIV